MTYSQYLRILRLAAAGDVGCTDVEFIRAAHTKLYIYGRKREMRITRHEWLRSGLDQLHTAQGF